ncbi:phosphate ABC transporter permease subunit PstC [Halobacteriales archaeon QS_8_69_73]|nr:MAG: phosphate ABC transporter permease subunit PstC [Halobacteriales archaeon QS_8_69_73]
MSRQSGTDGPSLERPDFVVRKERLYRRLLAGCAALTVAVTLGIILSLSNGALTFFGDVSIVKFLTGTNWSPLVAPSEYGVLPLVSGTLIIVVGSAVVALPIGLGAAIYLSEYADPRVRSVVKPALEILAGVPTVIYGYFALVYLTPILDAPLPIEQVIIPSWLGFSVPIIPSWLTFSVPIIPGGVPLLPEFTLVVPEFTLVVSEFVFVVPSLGAFNALSASIAVGIMIIPMVSSISEDAMSAVPDSLREAAYGLGSTKFDVSTSVVVPAAASGIISSYVLALSRAIGETMIVTMAAGQSPKMPYFPNVLRNFTDSIEAMTASIVKIASAESLGQTATYEAMFAIGLTLFGLTLTMNILAELVRRRFREVY